jgi:hypothetical protein
MRLLAAAAILTLLGCEQGAQGDRCNPDLVDSDECNSGLTCVQPPSCVVNVCCPTSPPYSDPQCECIANPQGSVCMQQGCNVDAAYDGMPTGAPDAGTDSSTQDAGKDGRT